MYFTGHESPATYLGGDFQLESARQAGTKTEVRIPLGEVAGGAELAESAEDE